MKRFPVICMFIVVIVATIMSTLKVNEFIALSRTEGYWGEIRFLQACAAEYYDTHQQVPSDLKELVVWAKTNGYHFDDSTPSYGMHVSYVPLSTEKCVFLNLQYGSVPICSFNDFANKQRRDIESRRSRGIHDWGWVEKKYTKGA